MGVRAVARILYIIAAVFTHFARGQTGGSYFTVVGGDIWLNCTIRLTSFIKYDRIEGSDQKQIFTLSFSRPRSPPEGYSLVNRQYLRYRPATFDDAMIYKCSKSESVEEYTWSVASPVAIHEAINSLVTVKSTIRTILKCSSIVQLGSREINPSLSIQWILGTDTHLGHGDRTTRNGKLNVSNSLDHQFTRGDDRKDITCRLLADGKVVHETSYKLNVQYPPHGVTVSALPLSQTIYKEGDTVTLTCKVAKANPGVKRYRWLHEEDEFPETSNQLTISGIQRVGAGDYTCKAENDAGVGSAKINILVKYLVLKVSASSSSVIEGNLVTITCTPEGLPETFNFGMWRHTDSMGVERFLRGSAGKSHLEFKRIRYDEAGKYCCSCSNGDFNRTACADVQVKFSPKADVSKPREFEVGTDISQRQSLILNVVANPDTAEFKWYKGTSTINEAKYKNNATTSVLTFDKVTKEDYGNYTCRAKNSVGATQFVFQLKPIAASSAPISLTVSQRTAISLTLSWISGFNGGRPQVFHVYYKPSSTATYESRWNILDPGQGRTVNVKLKNLAPATQYDVQVQSKNDLSKDLDGLTPVIKVTTKVRPARPQNVTIVRHGNVALVTWVRVKDNITGIGVQYCESSDCHVHMVSPDSTSVEIEADENTHYSFQLLLFDGEDVVQTSDTFNRQSVSETAPGADVAGIVVGLVILCLVIVIVVVVIIQRKKKLQGDKADIESDSFDSVHELEELEREPESRDLLLQQTPNNNCGDIIVPKDSNIHVVVAQMSITPNKSATDLRFDRSEQPYRNNFRRSKSSTYIPRGREDSASLSSKSSTYRPPRPPPPSADSLKRRSLVYADLKFDPNTSRESTPVRKKSADEIEYASIDFGNANASTPNTPQKPGGDNMSNLSML